MLNFMFRFILVSSAAITGYMLLSAISTIDVGTLVVAADEVKSDSAAFWLFLGGMVASIVGAVTSIAIAYFQFKLSMARITARLDSTDEKIDRTEKKVDNNTVITMATKNAVNGETEKKVEESYESGYRDASHGREKTPAPH